MSITQEITALPPAPARTDAPAVFVPKADAHVASLAGLVSEMNTFGSEVNTTQTEINTSEGNAATSATNSSTSASESLASAELSASSANFYGLWSGLTGALNKPASVSHINKDWRLLNNLADVTLSEPGVTADWQEIKSTELANPLTGGGTLIAGGIINQMRDSGSYAFPAANSVDADTVLVTELPTIYEAFQPTLTAFAGDLLAKSTKTDTTADYLSPVIVTWTSNGIDTWSY